MAFSAFTMLCDYHLYEVLKHFPSPQKESCSHEVVTPHSSLLPPALATTNLLLSLCIYLFWIFHINGIIPYDPANPLLDIYPRELKTEIVHKCSQQLSLLSFLGPLYLLRRGSAGKYPFIWVGQNEAKAKMRTGTGGRLLELWQPSVMDKCSPPRVPDNDESNIPRKERLGRHGPLVHQLHRKLGMPRGGSHRNGNSQSPSCLEMSVVLKPVL